MTPNEPVIVVSGLPRSGTSLMMQMLERGGLAPLTDNQRKPDPDNLRGYYELESVKRLDRDNTWVSRARGKVVKVVSALLRHLPRDFSYRVVFMRRNLAEVVASQKRMLARRGEPNRFSDQDLSRMYRNHLDGVAAWLAERPNFQVLLVDYNALLEDPPGWSATIRRFLGGDLDEKGMAAAVDKALYRQKQPRDKDAGGAG